MVRRRSASYVHLSFGDVPVSLPISDGLVTIRPLQPGDAPVLVAGRDEASHRWFGPGAPEPAPTACVVVDDTIVGWVDYELGHAWLRPGEVNVGYGLFAAHRGRGYASRAVQLLLHHLAVHTSFRGAALRIHPGNDRALAVAARTGFAPVGEVEGRRWFARALPPLTYTDGGVTIRRQRPEDLDADLEAKDDEQMAWLWSPEDREVWAAMRVDEQRAQALRGLLHHRDSFGTGPKWTFAVDADGAEYVAIVDCNLANGDVPRGEANLAFTAHPARRGRGYVSRAIRLLLRFLRDHTGARTAHIVVDADNVASLRVARAVGAVAGDRWVDDRGRTMIRHVVDVDRATPG